ncbi:MAG: DMP19 family protein [Planctomycetes bacterium]|nr:DMP19 family protein [Planctomycetota bacterium]
MDPLRKLYLDLVGRQRAAGEHALSEPERHYLAVALLDKEIHDGGFDQYFHNSSADSYDDAVRGLGRMGATRVLELLLHAKQVLFGRFAVPSNTAERRTQLQEPQVREHAPELEPLDETFCREALELSRLSEAYARAHRLL